MSKSNSNGGGAVKAYGRLGKKVEEVKEVIQNRTDADIIKVLEMLDNDVGRAIDAFINGITLFLIDLSCSSNYSNFEVAHSTVRTNFC
jgi:hypothetical protein